MHTDRLVVLPVCALESMDAITSLIQWARDQVVNLLSQETGDDTHVGGIMSQLMVHEGVVELQRIYHPFSPGLVGPERVHALMPQALSPFLIRAFGDVR